MKLLAARKRVISQLYKSGVLFIISVSFLLTVYVVILFVFYWLSYYVIKQTELNHPLTKFSDFVKSIFLVLVGHVLYLWTSPNIISKHFRPKQKMKNLSIFYQNLWSNFNHLVWQYFRKIYLTNYTQYCG